MGGGWVAPGILLSALGLGVVSILGFRFSILDSIPKSQVPGPKFQVPSPKSQVPSPSPSRLTILFSAQGQHKITVISGQLQIVCKLYGVTYIYLHLLFIFVRAKSSSDIYFQRQQILLQLSFLCANEISAIG